MVFERFKQERLIYEIAREHARQDIPEDYGLRVVIDMIRRSQEKTDEAWLEHMKKEAYKCLTGSEPPLR